MPKEMTNEVFFEILSPKIEELRKLREIGKLIAAGIIGQSLLKEDFFFCAATDRCMHLIDGFSSMLQERNLTCAGALLRLQLDNCMRTYAAFIAADKDAVIDCVISGNRIDKQKSKDGNLLKDVYLKKFSLAEARQEYKRLEERKRQLAEMEARKIEASKQKPETVPVPETAPVPEVSSPEVAPVPETEKIPYEKPQVIAEPIFQASFTVKGTKEQFVLLKEFMQKNNINYEVIK